MGMITVKWARAAAGGFVAGIVVILIMSFLVRLVGVDADLCLPVGAALTGDTGTGAWWLGFVLQLVIGVVAGVVYALIFEYVTRRATWWLGLLIAVPHALIAGLGVGFLFALREAPFGILPPGAFLEYRGAGAIATIIVAHLTFGLIVGASYGRTRRRAPTFHYVAREIPADETSDGQVQSHA